MHDRNRCSVAVAPDELASVRYETIRSDLVARVVVALIAVRGVQFLVLGVRDTEVGSAEGE